MDTISELLQQKRSLRLNSNWLSSGTTCTVMAGLSLIPQSVLWSQDVSDFRKWESEFKNGLNDLRENTTSGQKALNQQYALLIDKLGYSSLEEASLDQEFANFINRARNSGVKARWDFEQYFSTGGGEGARRSMSYVGDNGKEIIYDDVQFESLQAGNKVQVNGGTLEGHHINSVNSGLSNDFTNIDHLHNPENIRLMTRYSHLNDPERGHGGSSRNQTIGEANDVTQTADGIVAGNRDFIVNEAAAARELPISLGVALAAGSIAAILAVRKLQNDPRPWNKKIAIVAWTFALRGAEGGLISGAALVSRDAVTASPVSLMGAEAIVKLGADVSLDLGVDSIQNLMGAAVGLQAVVAFRLGIGSALDLAQGMSLQGIYQKHGQMAVVATGENLAFFLLGVAIDSAVPDPTGIVIGLRIIYSIGKTAYKADENRKSRTDCLDCRLRITYDQARKQLSA